MNSIKAIIDEIDNKNFSYDEKLRFLKMHRCMLLEEIHKKQQLLDQIDYLIFQIIKDK